MSATTLGRYASLNSRHGFPLPDLPLSVLRGNRAHEEQQDGLCVPRMPSVMKYLCLDNVAVVLSTSAIYGGDTRPWVS
jgi:hypothetical protein